MRQHYGNVRQPLPVPRKTNLQDCLRQIYANGLGLNIGTGEGSDTMRGNEKPNGENERNETSDRRVFETNHHAGNSQLIIKLKKKKIEMMISLEEIFEIQATAPQADDKTVLAPAKFQVRIYDAIKFAVVLPKDLFIDCSICLSLLRMVGRW